MNRPAPTPDPSTPRPGPAPDAPPATRPGEPAGPPGTDTAPVPPWNLGRLRVPEARASATSQVAVYLVATFALGIAGWASGGHEHAVAAMAALGLGALVGSTTEADRAFRHTPGVVVGILTTITLTVVSVMVANALRLDIGDADGASQLLLGAGLVVSGLDWRRVARLKVVPALAGILVLFVVATAGGPVLALGVAWLALALAALWSLEVDQRRAYPQPQVLGPAAGPPDDGARDLLGSLAVALLLGLVVASFAAVPSCSPSLGDWNLPWRPGDGPGDGPSGPDLLSFSTDRGAFGFDGSSGEPEVEIDGQPHRLVEDGAGRSALENLVTGERLGLTQEGDDLVARDETGTERARFRSVDQAPDDDDRGTDWRLVALAVLAVGAVTVLVWWWVRRRRRRPPPDDARTWAGDRVRELDRFGQSHRRPRSAGTTIHQHTAGLAASVAPDDRLHRVGDIVSDALFGRVEPTVEDRLWTERVILELTTAHPPPGWWRRRRLDSTADRSPDPAG